MSEKVLASVQVGSNKMEVREFDMPDVPDDGGILKIEMAGVCGADIRQYRDFSHGPRILGHENVGSIYKIGEAAASRWGVKEGDRVALEEYIPCGICKLCRSGQYRSCETTNTRNPTFLRYGSTPIKTSPSLWGGYSQYMYLHPNSVIHKLNSDVPGELAALALPISNGIQWAYAEGGVGPGKVVVIQGPGQQGIGCVVAARTAGAECIIISGLSKDDKRLETALALGADYAVNVEEEDLVEAVKRITGGDMADVVMDVSAGGPVTVQNTIPLSKKGGTIVLASNKKMPIPSLNTDMIISKHLTLKGVRGHSYESVSQALKVIQSRKLPLEKMTTHRFGLAQVDEAIRTVSGELNPGAIHVSVDPWS